EVTVVLDKHRILDICRFVHDEPTLDFGLLTDICSIDYPNEIPRFEVVYHLYSIEKNHRVRLKARVSEEDCTIDSVVDIWKGANFLEREVYDMMGIFFHNHPDLRRILMPEDFEEGYPLRKDFPVEGMGWRDHFENLSEE
ncbi:MAG: NADH-quinone oxidoreductase subunit C, partial [Nitrospiria bacterium]